MTSAHSITFNGPLEAGIRVLGLLLPAYPQCFDLQRLVAFDYLVVHTGDVGGPESLHPPLPLRSAELAVRRSLVEKGVLLMISRGLIERVVDDTGINYRAGDFAYTFMSTLTSDYLIDLQERARWVVSHFAHLRDEELRETVAGFFGQWIEEFHATQKSLAF
jgi:hypothetical protein